MPSPEPTHAPRRRALWTAVAVALFVGVATSVASAAEKHPEYSSRLKAFKKVIGGKIEVPDVPTQTDENAAEMAAAFGRVDAVVNTWPAAVDALARTKDARVFKELVKSLKRLQKTIVASEADYQEIYKQLKDTWATRFRQIEEFYRQEGRFPQSIPVYLKSAINALTPKSQRFGKVWNGYLRVRTAIERGLRTNLDVMGHEAEAVWRGALKSALSSKSAEDRAAFAMALAVLGGGEAESALLEIEKDAKEYVDTVAAIRALADMRSEKGLERIIARLEENEPGTIRVAAVRALRLYRHENVVPALIKALGTSQGHLLGELYDTLFAITGQRIAEAPQPWHHFWEAQGEAFLKRWSKDEAVRQQEIERITFQDPKQKDIAAELAALYGNESSEALKLEILESLSLQRSYYARVTLVEALRDSSKELRLAAIRGLGRYRHLAVPPALMERVKAIDPTDTGTTEELQELYTALKKLWGGEGEFTVSRPDQELLLQWWATNKGRVAEQLIKLAGGGAIDGRPPSPEKDSPWQGRNFYGLQIRSNQVLFIVDISFSMDEPANEDPNLKKVDVAKRELKRAIKSLPEGGTFGLIFFSYQFWQEPDRSIHTDSEDIKVDFGPGMMDVNKKNKERALKWIDAVRTGASTNIYDPLELGFKYGVDPDVVKESGDKVPDTIFLVSDGAPTSGKFTDVEVIREHVHKWNATGRITLNTIGVGRDQDIAFLRALAEENGGRYIAR